MANKSDELVQRNRFEAHLKNNQPAGYRFYVQCKKEAIAKGIDPVRHFRDVCAQCSGVTEDGSKFDGEKEAIKWWLSAIAHRLVEPEQEDVQWLRTILAKKHLDLDKTVDMLGGDVKAATDVIMAMNIDKLKDSPANSIYLIIDKLVRTKGSARNVAPVGMSFFDDISGDLLRENPDAFDLLVTLCIKANMKDFEEDFPKAEQTIAEKIESEKDMTKRYGYKRVLDYYRELNEVKIPGVVEEIFDKDSDKMISFPALHQKIAAQFIVDKKRMLIADEMGLGKTATSIIAKNLMEEKEGLHVTSVAVIKGEGLERWPIEISQANTAKIMVFDDKKEWRLVEDKDTDEVKRVVVITAQNKKEALEEIDRIKPDFIIVTYDMIFRDVKRTKKFGKKSEINTLEHIDWHKLDEDKLLKKARLYIGSRKINSHKKLQEKNQKLYNILKKKRLLGWAFSTGNTLAGKLSRYAEYLIVDEIHNAKNKFSRRAEALTTLSAHAEYVAMLSATPAVNGIEDVGIIASILWDHEFSPEEFIKKYSKNARVIRTHILTRMLRRKRENTWGTRKCNRNVVYSDMTKEQSIEHEKILLNREKLSALQLIQNLRKCALDPGLVGLEQDSPKYSELVEMLVNNSNNGEKAVVFSSELKEGIVDVLKKRLEDAGFKVAQVDGGITGRKREKQLEWFRKGDADILIATLKTLGEGTDLTVANKCYVIDPPFNDARFIQGVARLDRKGQKKDVDVYLFVARNSIDEGLLRLMEQKKRLEEFFLDGMDMTELEKKILKENPEKLVAAGEDPLRVLYRFFGVTTNREVQAIIDILKNPDFAGYVAEEYWNNFDGSLYGNTANMLAEIIGAMESGGRKFDNILDLASGPCCLGRVLNKKVVSLDANATALHMGKSNLEAQGKKAPGVTASFMDIPMKDGSFDLVVFSLALLHSAPNEREQILREVNRVMDKDGVLILTLPNPGKYEKLWKALPLLGFEVVPEVTGTARDIAKKKFECSIITAVKRSEATVDSIPVEMLDFSDETLTTENWEATVSSKIKRVTFDSFEIDSVKTEEAVTEAKEKLTVTERSFATLMKKYGSNRKIFEECPDSELKEQGVVVYHRNGAYIVAPDSDAESSDKYKRFTKRPNGPGLSRKAKKRLRK